MPRAPLKIRSEFFFFLQFSLCSWKLSSPVGKKWELQSPNKTAARLKNIILFSQHSSIWAFHFLSLMKQKEIMFVPISWSTYRLDYTPVKSERLPTAMLISRKWLEWDPWWHNSQRQCVKPVQTPDKISLLVCIHSYRYNWGLLSLMRGKTAEWAERQWLLQPWAVTLQWSDFQRPIPGGQNVFNIQRKLGRN